MTRQQPPTLDDQSPQPRRATRDDLAYFLPMAAFLAFVWAAAQWPKHYPLIYFVKAIVVTILLAACWNHYTKIRWNHWWLGAIVGVIGIVQWVAMQLLLQKIVMHVGEHTFTPFKPPPDPFDPFKAFSSTSLAWSWIVMRMATAALLVPVMEELFWRDLLWRSIIAPNDFKLAQVGEWDWKAFLIVAGAFATVHGNWWLTSIVWAMMIGWLLVRTKSLGACIVAHGVTNFLLALYVLYTRDWAFW